MSTSTRIGTAIAAGYFLGRFKKLRLALIVGSALANKNLRESGLSMLSGQAKGLTSSPEAQRIGGQITGQLAEAGKAAALTVASNRINRLSDALHERSNRIGEGAEPDQAGQADSGDEAAGQAAKDRPKAGGRKGKGRSERRAEPDEAADADESAEEFEEGDEEPYEDEAEDEAEDEDEEEAEDEEDAYDEEEGEPEDVADEEPEEDEYEEPEPEPEPKPKPRPARRRRAAASAGGAR